MIKSPLNYLGGKSKLLSQLLPIFPKEINTFVDLFCGGCNVGINVKANNVVFNDKNEELISLYKMFYTLKANKLLEKVYSIINNYNLSLASRNGYEYYNCNSSEGLGKYNKEKFNKLKRSYNKKKDNETASIILYVLIVYAFNNQIRFNNKREFNLPVGKRDFNKNMEEKLVSFVDEIQNKKCTFMCKDFRDFNIDKLTKNDFVYADPPYLITCATYNEQNGWNEEDEISLLNFLDDLNSKKIKFALSNVLSNKGKKNDILINWIKNKNYKLVHLNNNYNNCNYQTKNKDKTCDEVLVINY